MNGRPGNVGMRILEPKNRGYLGGRLLGMGSPGRGVWGLGSRKREHERCPLVKVH